jgi:hypothetical protein
MRLQTASETLSYMEQLQNQASAFYKTIIEKYGEDEEVYKTFIKENKRFTSDIMFSYRSVISDALEGCYAFDLESDDFVLDAELGSSSSYKDAIAKALAMEEKMIALYETGAEQSADLLADVPRAMLRVVKKINKTRVPKLKSL